MVSESGQKTIMLLGVVFLIVVLSFIFVIRLTVISDGEVGVKKTLGNFDDIELRSGIKVYVPILTKIYKINTKETIINEKISVPSKEGLMVELDASVIYSVREDMASEIKQTVTGDIKDTLLIPYLRNGLRDIASGYEAKAMYSVEGRKEISNKLQMLLESKLSDRLNINDALLRDTVLPVKIKEAIENKLDAELQAQAKEFELAAAKKDAEIDVARAQGIADSNTIISGSITPEYLKWKFIEALAKSGASVIYVPTEANLPILEATRSNTFASITE